MKDRKFGPHDKSTGATSASSSSNAPNSCVVFQPATNSDGNDSILFKNSLQHKFSQTSDANEERLPQVASSFLINMKRPLFQAVVVSQTDGIMLRTIHFVSLQKFF